MNPSPYMLLALRQAEKALLNNEVPVGAVIVDNNGKVVTKKQNQVERKNDPCAHAEILAIISATKKLGSKWLHNHSIYVTLEPCPMCAHAISMARLKALYFGAYDEKSGGVENGPRVLYNKAAHHKPEIYGGIMESKCSELLKNFFKGKRKNNPQES